MKKLLVANRGEIARRIFRTARRMELKTVAVYSEADAAAPHVADADEAICIGPALARDSYLSIEAILDAARRSGADTIHPGYGFLSENADFAESVRAAGLTFVGPPVDAIRIMGLKDSAKTRMKAAGVPVTPGYMGEDQGLARMERMAELIGYPLLIKAVAGGGGKGMRPVLHKSQFTESLLAAKREASAAFGNDGVMLEKLIARPRHVEVQIFADQHGNVVHLHERDCSIQRRHQKVIEEAPAPGLSDNLRYMLGIAAITAGMAIDYQNAGTVEFILDMDDLDEAGDPRFYFMEMNTRLQVEHPVTEAITGQDLVEWQLRIACGEMLPLMQEAIECRGHAIEARLYAEKPAQEFLPATGRIDRLGWPAGARVDSGVEAGSTIGIDYDPMLAKIIVHGNSRAEAVAAMVEALDATDVRGVETNRAFLARVAAHPDFAAGEVDTSFIARNETSLFAPVADVRGAEIALLMAHLFDSPAGSGPFSQPFRLNLPSASEVALYQEDGQETAARLERTADGMRVHLGDASYLIERPHISGGPNIQSLRGKVDGSFLSLALIDEGDFLELRSSGESWRLFRDNPLWLDVMAAGPADGNILAPMSGRVLNVAAKPGDRVKAGDRLLSLEAMKMEHQLTAPFDALVQEVAVANGAQVSEKELLVSLVAEDVP